MAVSAVRRQSHPVFLSKKLGQDLQHKEIKPSIVNPQCVVYRFSCDLRDADFGIYKKNIFLILIMTFKANVETSSFLSILKMFLRNVLSQFSMVKCFSKSLLLREKRYHFNVCLTVLSGSFSVEE